MSDESPILPQGKASISGLIIMLAIAALIPAAFIGGYLLSDYLGQSEPSNVAQDTTPDPIVETPVVQDGKPGKDDEDPKPVPASERIVVDGIGWYPPEEQIEIKESEYRSWLGAFFATTGGNEFLKKWSLGTISIQTTRLGLIETGEYAGYELREQYIYGGEMGGQSLFFHTLAKIDRNGGSFDEQVYIKRSQYSSNCMGTCAVYGETFSEAELAELAESNAYHWISLADIEIPELAWGYDEITIDGNSYYYTNRRLSNRGSYQGEDVYSVLIGETEDGHKLYGAEITDENAEYMNSALVVNKSDGYQLHYEMKLPIWPDEQVTAEMILTPNVTINGKQLTGSYAKSAVGGCGFTGVVRTVRQSDIPGLYEAGSVTGMPEEKIYLANFSDPSFDDEYMNWSRMRGAEATREAFAQSIPAFYYQDAIGRWLRIDSLDAVPPGECGKPVIYLYPEQTTDVSVQLDPQGGFTVTKPAYNTGWNVVAEPNGQLLNKADGLSYPYLFWEGRGGLYSEPEKFWVVAKADVEGFLVEKLSAFGFNSQEIADFNEFWLPRMEAAPWYKIGFHGTHVMDQIAPMNVSPAPDSVLRVLMDYSELQEPVAENAPSQIPSFKRNGFTVTEWGGVIR